LREEAAKSVGRRRQGRRWFYRQSATIKHVRRSRSKIRQT
jgi:hypothetical protein